MNEQDVWSQFGESNDSRRRGKYKTRFKLKEGEPSLFLFMPALFSCRETGEWIRFERVHWGFQYPASGGNKGEHLVFRCVRDMDWSVKPPRIKKHCPQCDKYDLRQAEYKQREQELLAAFKTHGVDGITAKDRLRDDVVLKDLSEWFKKFRASAKWNLNAMNVSGEFGYFSISNKSKIVLSKVIDEIIAKYKIDPRNPKNMVWWSIEPTSMKVQERTEIIRPVMDLQSIQDPNGGSVPLQIERLRIHALTVEQGKRCLKECVDLTKLAVDLSFAQIKELADSDGSPDSVARIVPKVRVSDVQTNEDNELVFGPTTFVETPTIQTLVEGPLVVIQDPLVAPVSLVGTPVVTQESLVVHQIALAPTPVVSPPVVSPPVVSPPVVSPPVVTVSIPPLQYSSEKFYTHQSDAIVQETAPARFDISKMSNDDFLKQLKV